MNKFLSILQSPTPVLADGAMGTLLHTHGVEHTHCFDALNLTDPAKVAEVHRLATTPKPPITTTSSLPA